MMLPSSLSRRNLRQLWPVLLLVVVVGCNQGMATVTGKVVYENDGSAVPAGLVMFLPTEKGQSFARSNIQPDGSYRLGTEKPGNGAKPGKYGVCIIPPDRSAERENGAKITPLVDSRYQDATTSGLEFEVQPGSNDFTIKVSRPSQ